MNTYEEPQENITYILAIEKRCQELMNELDDYKNRVKEVRKKILADIGLPQGESEFVTIGIEEAGFHIDKRFKEIGLE